MDELSEKNGRVESKKVLAIAGSISSLFIVIFLSYSWFGVPIQQTSHQHHLLPSKPIKQQQQPLSATVKFTPYKQPLELGIFLDRVASETKFDSSSRSRFMSIRGVLSLQVLNSDSKTLTGVEVFVPRSLFIEMTHKGEASKKVRQIDAIDRQIFFSDYEDYIEIGELGPQESLLITCWTSHSPEDPQFSRLRLVHDQGAGIVYFQPPN
ncbi:hypothetical protein [Gimesia fumaroli]|uniref:Uncharacterized protein n=1 Tax=Gimesia fumaroli TaxID=2527976 RepID=A0A518IHU1_9PLAN|nr:hypothetical protein [Gimesia fumaroli]QDV52663.1 hypothetical protein Enr17x_47290 [Gimesia fumaroli]